MRRNLAKAHKHHILVVINELEQSFDEHESCTSDNCSCLYKINMIRAETKLAFEMVDKITNEEERLEYLTKIKNILLQEEQPSDSNSNNKTEFTGYNFSEILKKLQFQRARGFFWGYW